MDYFVAWCVLAAVLAWAIRSRLKRAPYLGMPPEAEGFFVRLQEVLGERHPAIEVLGLTAEGFGMVLSVDRQQIQVPLGEVFLRERAFPDAFPQTVDRLVEEIRAHLAAIDDLPFDAAVNRILPQVRSQEWLRSHSPAFGPGRVITTPLHEDLVTCYVLDEEDSMLFVTEGHLAAWGTRAEDVANLAMTNLRRLAEQEGGLPLPAPDDATLHLLHTGDGYDATRVLLALDESALEATRGLVFAMPDRDTLVVGRKSGDVVQLMQEVEAEYASSEHPISPRLFEVRDAGLAPVSGPEEASDRAARPDHSGAP
jgi:uncharacterized protein YtpQ (UPF0354 family)